LSNLLVRSPEETGIPPGRRYADPMHATRTLPLVTSALLSVALVSAAGCSSSSSTSTTTTAPKSTTTTAPNPLDLPATGSVDGVTLSVTSSPLTGVAGKTTMHVNAQLTGSVTSSHSSSRSPTHLRGIRQGRHHPADLRLPRRDLPLPTAFHPSKAGNWAVTVTYAPTSAKKSKLSVSGMPPRWVCPRPSPNW